jgi:hypothetical protein
MSIKAPVAAKAPVIRTHAGSAYNGIDLTRLLPAWIISAVMHVVIILLFLALGLLDVRGTAGDITVSVVPDAASVDDQEDKNDLTETEMGNDPSIPPGYNVDRISPEANVPGIPLPNDPIGITGAPDGPTTSVPPPPGAGRGQGGGREDASGPPSALSDQSLVGGFYGRFQAGGFNGRSAATKEQLVKEGGGTGASEAAVGNGLKWLALHQGDDGRWSLDAFDRSAHEKGPALGGTRFKCNCGGQGMRNDTAGTAFGVLPFLAAGVTPRSQNEMKEDYRKNVEAALKFLVNHQDPKTGDLGGGMYAHGLAAIALCEAYGLTSDPTLKGPAQKALDFIVAAQDPASGGWRYTPRSGGDTSVVGWQLMAIKSGQMAGLNVPNPTLVGAEKWLNSVQASGGGYGYVAPQETPTMSAVGLLCRQYLGWSYRHLGLINGVAYLKQYPPGSVNSIYYYYYATQVMHHMGGDSWSLWNPKMRDMLVNSQDQGRAPRKPHQIGSWSPDGDAHGAQGGRIMQTSLSLLTLEVYYRHLPLYSRNVTSGKEKEMESKQQ